DARNGALAHAERPAAAAAVAHSARWVSVRPVGDAGARLHWRPRRGATATVRVHPAASRVVRRGSESSGTGWHERPVAVSAFRTARSARSGLRNPEGGGLAPRRRSVPGAADRPAGAGGELRRLQLALRQPRRLRAVGAADAGPSCA